MPDTILGAWDILVNKTGKDLLTSLDTNGLFFCPVSVNYKLPENRTCAFFTTISPKPRGMLWYTTNAQEEK